MWQLAEDLTINGTVFFFSFVYLVLYCMYSGTICLPRCQHGGHSTTWSSQSSVSMCMLQGWAWVVRLISKYLDALSYLRGPMIRDTLIPSVLWRRQLKMFQEPASKQLALTVETSSGKSIFL